jgi:hypothetical protein
MTSSNHGEEKDRMTDEAARFALLSSPERSAAERPSGSDSKGRVALT